MNAGPRRAPRSIGAIGAIGAVLALAIVAPRSALAEDTLSGRAGQPIRDLAHEVRVTMGRGHAQIRVRRTVQNDGALTEVGQLDVTLAPEGVATGLRMLTSAGEWHAAQLWSSAQAEARFNAATSLGEARATDAALMSWRGAGAVGLELFPLRARGSRTVEYTSLVATTYDGGKDLLELPRLGTKELPATLVVLAAHAGDQLFLGGVAIPSGSARAMADKTLLAVQRPDASVIGRLADVPIEGGRHVVHARIDLPARLGERPDDARVVVVLDASRSMTKDETTAMRAAARAYLSAFPGARARLVTFDRDVTVHGAAFADAAEVAGAVETVGLSRRNGSRLDAALARASALLQHEPVGAPRRVLVLTDLLTRSALTPAVASKALEGSGALLHVGVIAHGMPAVDPDDQSPFGAVARATGGLVWHARAGATPAGPDDARVAYEELVRPKRVHRIKVTLGGAAPSSLAFPSELGEGSALEELSVRTRGAGFLGFEGELWAKRFGLTLLPDDAEGERWAALALTSNVSSELTDEDQRLAATRGHAVSAHTSLLLVAKDAGPSREGTDVLRATGLGLTGGSGSSGDRIGFGSSGRGGRFPGAQLLRDLLMPHYRACGGTGPASLVVETTRTEVVDAVDLKLPDGATAGVRGCLVEAAFSLELPPEFVHSFARWDVHLDAT